MNRKIGVVLSYCLMIFEVLSTLLLTPFIIRTLGQAEYGVFKLSNAVISYVLLLDLGVGNAVIRYASMYRCQNNKKKSREFLGIATIYYSIIAFLALIFGYILLLIYPTVFAKGLSPEEIELGQKLLSITILNTAFTLGTTAYSNTITAYERFDVAKGWSIGMIIFRIIFTYIALKLGMGSIGIVTVNFVTNIIGRTVFVLFVLFGLKIVPSFRNLNSGFIKEIAIYSSFILLQMVATHINAFADEIMLGAFVSSSSILIAIYGVGHQIVGYFQNIGSAVTGVLMPGVVRLVEDHSSPDKICDEMIRVGRMILMLLGIILVCFTITGKEFISLWAGRANIKGYYVALILMFAYTFVLTQAIGEQILWATSEHKEESVIKIVIVCINVLLTYCLIKWNPIIGATIGTCISLFFGDVLLRNVLFVKKIGINIVHYYLGLGTGIVPSLFIVFFAGIFINHIPISGWSGFLIHNMCMVLVYIIAMALYGMNDYEKDFFGRFFKSIMRH